ncbi:MAG: hypothetical protein QOJ42_6860 [Acidobacteriaceae bacterium]|jgi:hypothetical protein|nr:hypothetical protein [Acidobacteriaceae bacterium]
MMGAYAVIDPKGNELHYSYASPGAIDSYHRNKKFAAGTVLVKEVFGTEHAQLSTGNANWASNIKVWFVLIKDAKGRYPNNPLWGDGWGWALFKSDAPEKQAAVDYKKDCLSCHVPAKADDWIYVKGYPTLHSRWLKASRIVPKSIFRQDSILLTSLCSYCRTGRGGWLVTVQE